MIAELEYKDDHLLYVLHGNFIINQNYEKTIPSYLGLFKLACIVLTSTRI